MSYHPVTFYQAKCDECGYIETDYFEFAAFTTPEAAIAEAQALFDWDEYENDEGIKDLCPNCVKNAVNRHDSENPNDKENE